MVLEEHEEICPLLRIFTHVETVLSLRIPTHAVEVVLPCVGSQWLELEVCGPSPGALDVVVVLLELARCPTKRDL